MFSLSCGGSSGDSGREPELEIARPEIFGRPLRGQGKGTGKNEGFPEGVGRSRTNLCFVAVLQDVKVTWEDFCKLLEMRGWLQSK